MVSKIIAIFFEGPTKRFPSAPMGCSAITKIAHVVDKSYNIKRNGPCMMFNVPNHPMCLTRVDNNFMGKEKMLEKRRENLIEKLESENQSKTIEKGKSFVKIFAYSQFWSMENEIKTLELENSILRK